MLSIANSCGIRFDRVAGYLSLKGVKYQFFPALNSVLKYSDSKPVCPPSLTKGCPSASSSKPTGGSKKGACGAVKGPGDGSGKNTFTYKPYVPICPQDHDFKNMSLKRPMSPHLTIFTMTPPATMSVMQRATGCILAAYAMILAGGTIFLPNGVETYVTLIQSLNLGWFSTFFIKIMLGAPFAYHYFNGIRFCMWNTGRWLSLNEVDATAKKAIAAAAVTALLFAFL